MEPCGKSDAARFGTRAGIVFTLAAGAALVAPAIGADRVPAVNWLTAGVLEFAAEFFSADFPGPETVVATACDRTGTAESLRTALCKVLAKLLAPCPEDCRGDWFDLPDVASAWITLASTGSVSRLFCQHSHSMHAEHQRFASPLLCRRSK
jgi:hypothetical protein